MIKETLIGAGAALAGGAAYFFGLIPAVTPYITTGIGTVSKVITSNPLITTAATAVGGVVASLAIRAGASKTQDQMAATADQERTSIINQAQTALAGQTQEIATLKTQIDAMTKQQLETAQLQTQIASLQTQLTAAQQQAQRTQDEYNALIRINAVSETLPPPESTVH